MDGGEKKGKFREISVQLLQANKEPKDAIKEVVKLKQYQQSEDLLIAYGTSSSDPQWKNIYQIDAVDADLLKNSNAYLVFFVKFDVGTDDNDGDLLPKNNSSDIISSKTHRWMVICHGKGHCMLESGAIESYFGLNVVLKVIDQEKITLLGLMATASQNATFRGNHPKGAAKCMFRMHKNDIIKKCAGKVAGLEEVNDIGSNVAGSNMLKVRFLQTKNLEQLPDLCKKYFDIYYKEKDKMWVSNNRKPVANKITIAALEKLLVKSIKQRFEKMEFKMDNESRMVELNYGWTEEPIDYGEVTFPELGSTVYEELNFDNYLQELRNSDKEKDVLKSKKYAPIINMLKKHHVQLCREIEEETVTSWTIKQRIMFDIKYKNNSYIHREGTWYEITNNYIEEMNNKFNEVLRSSNLPPYDEKKVEEFCPNPKIKKEAKYNLFAATKTNYLCLDKDLIPAIKNDGRDNKFELCDLLSPDGTLIHVKFYGRTAAFGHIFNQARISGKLLHEDENVRKAVYKKIQLCDGTPEQTFLKIIKQKSKDLTVCYGVITKIRQFRLPVMILFYEATKELEKRGYKIALEWIDDISLPINTKATTSVISNAIQPNLPPLPVPTSTSTPNKNIMLDSGIDSFFENLSNSPAKLNENIGLSESQKSINENIPVPSETLLKSDNDSSQSSSDSVISGKRRSSIDNINEQLSKREKTEIITKLPQI